MKGFVYTVFIKWSTVGSILNLNFLFLWTYESSDMINDARTSLGIYPFPSTPFSTYCGRLENRITIVEEGSSTGVPSSYKSDTMNLSVLSIINQEVQDTFVHEKKIDRLKTHEMWLERVEIQY